MSDISDEAAPVSGELMSPPPEVATVKPPAADVRKSAQRHLGRSAQALAIATQVMVVSNYAAKQLGLDLDRFGAGVDMPADAAAAGAGLIALGVGYLMARSGLRATDDE